MSNFVDLDDYIQEKMSDEDFAWEYYKAGFGSEIRTARLRKKMTQAELARLAGTKQSVVARIESGDYPTFDLLKRLCVALHLYPTISFNQR